MTTSRLAILLAVLLAGLGSIHFLPKQLGYQPVGIDKDLPEFLGEWWGQPIKISQKEIDTLGHDTEFSRRDYVNGSGDHVLASVVLAGQDMMTSIHRPERCLRAQGWDFRPGGERLIEIPGRGKLPVRRLHNSQTLHTADGTPIEVENICYYWFAGSKDLTASHLNRVWLDTRDRLFGGYVQRWAMIMISADITANRTQFGRDEEATDKVIEDFIRKLAPRLHKEGVEFHGEPATAG